jgi:hypothetical protein
VGTTLAVSDSSGTRLNVTVQKVIDPASGKIRHGVRDLPGANGDKVATVRYGNTVYPGTTAEWRLP